MLELSRRERDIMALLAQGMDIKSYYTRVVHFRKDIS